MPSIKRKIKITSTYEICRYYILSSVRGELGSLWSFQLFCSPVSFRCPCWWNLTGRGWVWKLGNAVLRLLAPCNGAEHGRVGIGLRSRRKAAYVLSHPSLTFPFANFSSLFLRLDFSERASWNPETRQVLLGLGFFCVLLFVFLFWPCYAACEILVS